MRIPILVAALAAFVACKPRESAQSSALKADAFTEEGSSALDDLLGRLKEDVASFDQLAGSSAVDGSSFALAEGASDVKQEIIVLFVTLQNTLKAEQLTPSLKEAAEKTALDLQALLDLVDKSTFSDVDREKIDLVLKDLERRLKPLPKNETPPDPAAEIPSLVDGIIGSGRACPAPQVSTYYVAAMVFEPAVKAGVEGILSYWKKVCPALRLGTSTNTELFLAFRMQDLAAEKVSADEGTAILQDMATFSLVAFDSASSWTVAKAFNQAIRHSHRKLVELEASKTKKPPPPPPPVKTPPKPVSTCVYGGVERCSDCQLPDMLQRYRFASCERATNPTARSRGFSLQCNAYGPSGSKGLCF